MLHILKKGQLIHAKLLALCAVLCLLAGIPAGAESLFPSPDALFGVTMPDIRCAVNRPADSQTTAEGAQVLANTALTLQENEVLDVYLAPVGLSVDKPSMKAATDKEAKEKAARLKLYQKAGSIVTFGTYPQTEEGTDKTPIEWIVLKYDKKNNRSLLLSRYGLDAQPYNKEQRDVTWETCTLRTWLNENFYKTAFTKAQRKAIVNVTVKNDSSQGYSEFRTDGGKNTKDKIFLLSFAEANKYLDVTYFNSSNTKSRLTPTAYAVKQGVITSSVEKTADGAATGWWYLRSPGYTQSLAAIVLTDGSMSYESVDSAQIAIRPALWINLESDIF